MQHPSDVTWIESSKSRYLRTATDVSVVEILVFCNDDTFRFLRERKKAPT